MSASIAAKSWPETMPCRCPRGVRSSPASQPGFNREVLTIAQELVILCATLLGLSSSNMWVFQYHKGVYKHVTSEQHRTHGYTHCKWESERSIQSGGAHMFAHEKGNMWGASAGVPHSGNSTSSQATSTNIETEQVPNRLVILEKWILVVGLQMLFACRGWCQYT